ncbi:unnamed protein product [Blepharisma stoltei]|uniref:Uncharacterized protein n=1 Tax=Blepharisma stoltei TaxID=1481888 RepID=A0AAU9IF85_9CILI|nr:unnamed protein product [Blepharisma stoltei]
MFLERKLQWAWKHFQLNMELENQDKSIILIEKNADLEERQAIAQDGNYLARAKRATYFETSALAKKSIDTAFRTLINEIAERG